MSDAFVYDPTLTGFTSNIRPATVEESLADEAYREVQRDPGSWWKSDWHTFALLNQTGFAGVLADLRQGGYIEGYEVKNPQVFDAALMRAGFVPPIKTGFDDGARGYGPSGPTRAEQIENMMANMRAAALAWNIRIDDPNLRNLATTAVNGNYNNQQVMNSIGRWVIAQEAGTSNLADGPLGQAMNDLAKNYGVQVSKDTINRYLQGFVQGTETQESITALLQKQATNMYPALAERFAAGETFADITSQYREIAARLLEKEAGSFDFISSNLNKAFTYNPDGKQERMMSMGEFTNYLRQNREFGYEYTNDARNKAYGTVRALSDLFGRA